MPKQEIELGGTGMRVRIRLWTWLLAAGLAGWAPVSGQAETFTYKVRHEHLTGSCQGVLVVGEQDVRYESDYRDHSRIWTYLAIKKIESPGLRELSLHTFEEQTLQLGRDKVFNFEFIDGEVSDELYNFIVNRIARPESVEVPQNPPGGRWEIAAKHRHLFGGCEGTLKITDTHLEYVTNHTNDTRVWKYLDVKRIESPSAYRLDIHTYEDQTWQLGRDKIFHFELKEPLEPEVLEFIREHMR